MPSPERPVMRRLSRPGVAPRARVAAEVDARGSVADLQQRACHHGPLGNDEAQVTVTSLADAERRDWAVGDIELHRNSPASLAVVDTQASQQRAPLANGQVGWTVVAPLHPAVA